MARFWPVGLVMALLTAKPSLAWSTSSVRASRTPQPRRPSAAWSDELIPGCSKRCHQLADPVGVYGRGAIALPPPMFSQCSDRVFTERRKRGKLWTREDLECRV